MITSKTLGSRISQAVIWVLVIAMALICLLPLLNMVAISFSSSTAVSANIVGIYPVNPTLESYTKLLADAQFWRSFGISVLRVVLGASLNVLLTILMAYPLSKPISHPHLQKRTVSLNKPPLKYQFPLRLLSVY